MNITELAGIIQPARTSLLFGAGASIPSGGPTSSELVEILSHIVNIDSDDFDLAEIAQIVEDQRDRRTLVTAIRNRLSELTPAEGLLALPQFDWNALYTTNYDTLVEQAYKIAGRDLDICRSNFEYRSPTRTIVPLYKIHGCITQDRSDGHKSGMLITENDYEEFSDYRQALFNSLNQNMSVGDTLIVGQSLADRHLKDLVKTVKDLKNQGISGRIFLLVHEYEKNKASLYTRMGVEVIHGTLSDLLLHLVQGGKSLETPAYSTSSDALLSPELVLTSIDISHATNLSADALRMFNGAPASYADIRSGLTMRRSALDKMLSTQSGPRGYFLTIEGTRGVGKTSLARSFMLEQSKSGAYAWEHKGDHELDPKSWLQVNAKLHAINKKGYLLVDDCTRNMNTVNRLVTKLAEIEHPNLRVIVTSDTAKWRQSTKSPGFFQRGNVISLSRLSGSDIEELINLLDHRPEIRQLVEQRFLGMPRGAKVSRLKEKCQADMFVCLKNIFANDNLDEILLGEYKTLSQQAQDVYRHVAAIQAFGGQVHRQLIVRTLNVEASSIDGLLSQLEGIILEYDVEPKNGIFGWKVRHDVIATVIAKWKFAAQDELYDLLNRLILSLNPTQKLEMETAMAIAGDENAIAKLVDLHDRIELHKKLISIIPANRTARRRLVRLYLQEGMLSEADHEIQHFDRSIGFDSIITRYKARISLQRAITSENLEKSDRIAMLLSAESEVWSLLTKFGHDRDNYRVLGDIGIELLRLGEDYDTVDYAIEGLRKYSEENGDPEISRDRRNLETKLRDI